MISDLRPGSNFEFKNSSLKRTGITIHGSGMCDACRAKDLKIKGCQLHLEKSILHSLKILVSFLDLSWREYNDKAGGV